MQPTLNPDPSCPSLLPASAEALRAKRRQGSTGKPFLLLHYSQLHPKESAEGFPGIHSSSFCLPVLVEPTDSPLTLAAGSGLQ